LRRKVTYFDIPNTSSNLDPVGNNLNYRLKNSYRGVHSTGEKLLCRS